MWVRPVQMLNLCGVLFTLQSSVIAPSVGKKTKYKMKKIKETLMKEKSPFNQRALIYPLFLLCSFLSSSSFITQITQDSHHFLSCQFPPSVQNISLCHSLLPPSLFSVLVLCSLVFPSLLFSPASFLLVARLLLLSVLFNFMPGFLSAPAQSHKVSLSSQCCKIRL